MNLGYRPISLLFRALPLLFLCLFPVSASAIGDEELCKQAVQWFDFDGVHWWKPDRNPRLEVLIKDLAKKKLLPEKILVCSGEGWLGETFSSLTYFGKENGAGDKHSLLFHQKFIKEVPDRILRIVLLHEGGHFTRGHARKLCDDPYNEEVSLNCEREADDFAARIAGPCEVAGMLHWVRGYYDRHNVSIFRQVLTLRAQRLIERGRCAR